MRLPLSPKTLLRLHRRFFMLRRPRRASHTNYSLSLAPDGKAPLIRFCVEKKRPSLLGTVLAVLTLLLAVIFTQRK